MLSRAACVLFAAAVALAGCGLAPNVPANTDLETALYAGARAEAVQDLLEAGEDPNEGTGLGPLGIAVANGDPAVVRVLLDGGADPTRVDANGNTYLLAVVFGVGPDNDGDDFRIATLLVDRGTDPCLRPSSGRQVGLLASEAADNADRPGLARLLRSLETACVG